VGGDPHVQPLDYAETDRRGYSAWDVVGLVLALISGAIAVIPWWFVWDARRDAGLRNVALSNRLSTGISVNPIFYVVALTAAILCSVAWLRGGKKLAMFGIALSLAAVGATILVTSLRW